jgi:glucose/mannose transport system substrate-binding protein
MRFLVERLRNGKIFRLLYFWVMLALVVGACAQKPEAEKSLEIFSWWTNGNDSAGLDRLYNLYGQENQGVRVVNAVVAGSLEITQTMVLASRMQGGDPPDTFQTHIGQELIDNWVVTGRLENLDGLYQAEGWETSFPRGVLDLVSYQGHYFSVPLTIHRLNLMWYNKQTFRTAGILNVPKTFDEWIAMAELCKAAGLPALALGDSRGSWTSTALFETVLIGSVGADGYKGLWTGATSWTDPKVTIALENFKKMLGYVNDDHASLSWDQANQLIIDGKACTTILPDWVDADNLSKKFTSSGWTPAPDNGGIYDVISDSFVLAKGARDPANTLAWLRLVGSKAGQEAFNPVKGSVCVRTDCNPDLFGPYLQWAGQEWIKDTVVPSLAFGSAAKPGWLAAISDAINTFVTTQDVAATQTLLVNACAEAKICK